MLVAIAGGAMGIFLFFLLVAFWLRLPPPTYNSVDEEME